MPNNTIIHIAGASGSGKTTLGNKLKKNFDNKIVVEDIDDLWLSFSDYSIKNKVSYTQYFDTFAKSFQQYIDQFIDEHKSKIIIFVGINVFIQEENDRYPLNFDENSDKNADFWEPQLLPQNIYFNLHANYLFYIDIPIDKLLKQKFVRMIKGLCDETQIDNMFNNLLKDQKKEQTILFEILEFITNLSQSKEQTLKWDKYYKDKGYTLMSADNIYTKCIEIINPHIISAGSYDDLYLKYKHKYLQTKKINIL